MEKKDNKDLVNIVLVGGMLYVIYKITKYFGGAENTKKEEETVKAYAKDLNDLKKLGITPTFSDTKYMDDADSLKRLFSGLDNPWSELNAVQLIVNCVKNMADWVKLKQAFGVRDVNDAFYGSQKYTLPQLLSSQLDLSMPITFRVKEDNPLSGVTPWSYTSIFGGDNTKDVLNKFLLSRIRITI